MSRLEEYEHTIKLLRDNKVNDTVYLTVMIEDIAKSLAVIADKLYKEETSE